MYLFDANIFLEILLDRDKAEDCEKQLALVDEDKPGWISSYSLHSMEVILTRAGKMDILGKFLSLLIEDPLLQRYETSVKEELAVLSVMKSSKLDFDDALQYSIARTRNLTLVTLDHDFKKVKDLSLILL